MISGSVASDGNPEKLFAPSSPLLARSASCGLSVGGRTAGSCDSVKATCASPVCGAVLLASTSIKTETA
eukprot:CAMPEP_0184520208 /NCGR_PEP_ID=MMETSP0198_2-20121128/7041_1 /TAXON_ID=1112570 /ORGANISM="Thraustochytrium sp., Strain LLF1b" /LENGTH=68 /DNA_ID=CAMNT_0026910783 /DNA_START=157 /DNA_END=363 /DNA_ORIENTATION=-